jgi:hypothetical protein
MAPSLKEIVDFVIPVLIEPPCATVSINIKNQQSTIAVRT